MGQKTDTDPEKHPDATNEKPDRADAYDVSDERGDEDESYEYDEEDESYDDEDEYR